MPGKNFHRVNTVNWVITATSLISISRVMLSRDTDTWECYSPVSPQLVEKDRSEPEIKASWTGTTRICLLLRLEGIFFPLCWGLLFSLVVKVRSYSYYCWSLSSCRIVVFLFLLGQMGLFPRSTFNWRQKQFIVFNLFASVKNKHQHHPDISPNLGALTTYTLCLWFCVDLTPKSDPTESVRVTHLRLWLIMLSFCKRLRPFSYRSLTVHPCRGRFALVRISTGNGVL